MTYIYKITNKVNNKSYIGYTTNPQARWEGHRHNQGSKLVFQAIKKYGIDNFEFKVIAEDTIDNEQKYIDKYNTIAPHGYNIAIGGSLPPRPWGSYIEMYGSNIKAKNFSTKQKQAGGYGPMVHSEKTKKKISKNNGRGMLGKTHSTKTLKLMSAKRKGVHVGSKNGNAKQFVITSPDGKTYTAHGNLREMCETLGLNFATVRKSHELDRPMRSGWRVKLQ